MTESEFLVLCQRHDLTFDYSDDHSVWQRGCVSLAKVREAATQLPPDVAASIWNSVVERKLMPSAWDQYKWKVPANV